MRVRRLSASLALLAACLAIGAWAGATPEKAQHAVVFFSSDMRGYLGPCGCSENMRGGIPRAAHQVKEARRTGVPVFYVDAGDSLFGQERIEPERVPQEERKARALADAFRQMKLAARANGEKDDARGPAFRTKLGLPELAPGEVKLLDANGRKIAIVAGSDAKTLKAAAGKARADGAVFAIGLLHQADAKFAIEERFAMAQLGRAHDMAGRSDSAVVYYERYIATPDPFPLEDARVLAQIHRRLGELYEAAGKPRQAMEHYGRFVELWAKADPVLQPQVTEAKKRLERLRAQVG